jgi:hypothetical protein
VPLNVPSNVPDRDAWIPAAIEGLGVKAGELARDLAGVPAGDWSSSAAAAWFNTLSSFGKAWPEGYPLYMRSRAFPAKELETFMGGFTELKHSMLLYEKPNYGAEMGDGEEDPGKPKRLAKGLVEPNLEFWARMSAALDVAEAGFRRMRIYPQELEGNGGLSTLKGIVSRLGAIASKELAGEAVTEDDYEFLRTFTLSFAAKKWYGQRKPDEVPSGLVVDVQTYIGGGGESMVVHEGTAPPYLMLVLAGNDGEKRVAAGLAYNHYEFVIQGSTRLTDRNWKAVAYSGLADMKGYVEGLEPSGDLPGLPQKNFWYAPTLE